MKTRCRVLIVITVLVLVWMAGCKTPENLSLYRSRIFLLSRLILGKACDVRLYWRKAPNQADPIVVKADLSRIGGPAQQEMEAGDNGTWHWSGQVIPEQAGNKIVTITALTESGVAKKESKQFLVLDTNKAVAIAKNQYISLAVRADGSVLAWDCPDNQSDPLYASDHGQCNVPAEIADVVDVKAGNGFAVVLMGNGRVAAWGEYESVIEANEWNAIQVPDNLSDVIEIYASGNLILALRADGTIVVWGSESYTRHYGDVIGLFGGIALRNDGSAIGIWDPVETQACKYAVAMSGGYIVNAWGHVRLLFFSPQRTVPLRLGGGVKDIVAFPNSYTIKLEGDSYTTFIYMAIGLRRNGTVTVWWGGYRPMPLIIEGLDDIVALAPLLALKSDGSVISFYPDLVGFKYLPVPEDVR